MSQRPRSGGQARTTSAGKTATKDMAAKADPAMAEAEGTTEPAATEPEASRHEFTTTEPADGPVGEQAVKDAEEPVAPMTAEPVAEPEPVLASQETTGQDEPAVALTPAVPPVADTSVVHDTVMAGSDLAAASAKVVSTTLTATANTVAAVTEEAVEAAASTEPKSPTLTQGIRRMMKSTEDFVAFGQANLEAFVKSGQIWSAGVQELTRQIASSAKASFDDSVSTFKAISTAKSVKEAMDLQSSFAKSAFEKAMAESNKLTDASIKLTEQTLAPITARVTVAVESFGKPA